MTNQDPILARHLIPNRALRPLLVVIPMADLFPVMTHHRSLRPRIRLWNQQTHFPKCKSLQDNESGLERERCRN
jgi:hypothetical protein